MTAYRMQLSFDQAGRVEVKCYRRDGEAWLLDAAGTSSGETATDIIAMATAITQAMANGRTPTAMRATIDQLAEHVKQEARRNVRRR